MTRSRSSSGERFFKKRTTSRDKSNNSNESLMSILSLSSDESIDHTENTKNKNEKKANKKIIRERDMTYEKDIISKSPQIEKWMEFMSEYQISSISNGWGFYVDLKESN